MKVTDYIKTNGLEALKEEFKIDIKEYDNYVVLNYNQIESPKHDSIVSECRALILDKNTWEPLARSFDRFFNYGEDPNSTQFSISKAISYEKIDGSLIPVWWNQYLSRWNVSTRKMAHAEGETAQGNTYFQVVKKAFGFDIQNKFSNLDKNRTYVFELVSPETRVVKPYPNYQMCLLTIRDKNTGEEFLNEINELAEFLWVKTPKEYKFNTIPNILDSMEELDTFDEGYVCAVENNGRIWRIKIKNPSYLAIAHLRENGVISKKRIAILVLGNDEEEYLQYFPEDRDFFVPFIEARNRFMVEINELWEKVKNIENQKDFALLVKDKPYSAMMFAKRKGVDFGEFLKKSTDKYKESLLSNMGGE